LNWEILHIPIPFKKHWGFGVFVFGFMMAVANIKVVQRFPTCLMHRNSTAILKLSLLSERSKSESPKKINSILKFFVSIISDKML